MKEVSVMAQKEDLRVRKTKKAISEAFMALLGEKPIEEMTVNELCDRADVRRTTFYKHYRDKYDYIASFAKGMRDRFDDIIWRTGKPDITPEYYVQYAKQVVSFISKHETEVNNILNSPIAPTVVSIISEQNYKDTYNKLVDSEKSGMMLSASPEVVSSMIVGAVSNTIYAWLMSGRTKDADTLAEEIGNIVRKCLE